MSRQSNLAYLKKAYKDKKLMLFLGAGVSAALDLPSWDELIDFLAEDCGYEPSVFKILGDGNALVLAEYYYIKNHKKFGVLRSKLEQTWHRQETEEKLKRSYFHTVLAEKDFNLIYTTNYDQWIERAFDLHGKEYSKITNILDVSKAQKNRPQIVKFHGDFTDDNSFVLNESSYYRRMKYDDPIDIKFKSDLLSHSVLFIGYSLSDLNVRRVMFELNSYWPLEYKSDKPKCYILVRAHNEVVDTVYNELGVIPITAEDLGVSANERPAQNAEVLELISS